MQEDSEESILARGALADEQHVLASRVNMIFRGLDHILRIKEIGIEGGPLPVRPENKPLKPEKQSSQRRMCGVSVR